jgi:hypothetical protein
MNPDDSAPTELSAIWISVTIKILLQRSTISSLPNVQTPETARRSQGNVQTPVRRLQLGCTSEWFILLFRVISCTSCGLTASRRSFSLTLLFPAESSGYGTFLSTPGWKTTARNEQSRGVIVCSGRSFGKADLSSASLTTRLIQPYERKSRQRRSLESTDLG